MSNLLPTRPSADTFVCVTLTACAAAYPLHDPLYHARTNTFYQTIMSNSAEVAETRLQLQGALTRNGYHVNTLDAIRNAFSS